MSKVEIPNRNGHGAIAVSTVFGNSGISVAMAGSRYVVLEGVQDIPG